MNHDDNNPRNPTPADLELEARIVAWVSGEASAFEAAELERIISERPELAIFKRRIEAVRGLVGEAIRPDQASLVMSADRRAKLLQAIGGTDAKAPAASAPSVVPMPAARTARRTDLRWMSAIAAVLVVGFISVVSISRRSNQEMEARLEPLHEPTIAVALPQATEEKATDETVSAKAREILKTIQQSKGLALTALQSSAAAAPSPVARAQHWSAPASAASSAAGSSAHANLQGSAVVSGVLADRLRRDGENDGGGTAAAFSQRRTADGRGASLSSLGGLVAGQTGPATPKPDAGRIANELDVSATANQPAETFKASSDDKDDKAIVLSPFVVSALENNGYVGPSELAKAQTAGSLGGKKEKSAHAEDDDRPLPAPAKTEPSNGELPEVNASKEPVSTFSLHVSDVSFRLARAALARNETPDEDSIRPEEFYNAFDYGDPTPTMAEKVSCRTEQSAHPFLQQRNLVRIAIKVPATGRDAAQPLRLTVLLDTSGSMEREDRAAIAGRAMQALVSLLGPNDRLTLIGFARRPRLLAESLPGNQAAPALELARNTPAEGGTNLEEALKLATQLAQRQFEPAAQNRIVVLTDGAANLGNADPAQLAGAVESLRQQGIAFDACGVGRDGLDDAMLERLTRQGSGRYYLLNSPDEADAGFARQLAGAFHPAAENVKLQVRFNPARVGNYRLIGFEQHRLREEDFRNDQVAAAALAGEEAAVAVYQVEARPQGEGELGEVYVRFRDTATGTMVERSWTLSYEPQAPAFDQATPTMQLAGTAALLAEKLRGGDAGDSIKLGELAPVVNKLRGHYAREPRVQDLVAMFEQARRLAGE